MSVLLEIAVDTMAGARAAVAAGAGRLELCAALSEGGLTPSLGAMRTASALPLPVFAMIRPRGGDFVYSAEEAAVMRRDIAAARNAGMAGLVFGALRRDGLLDADLLGGLIAEAAGLPVTLHRAFDQVPDAEAALEQAIELGFARILTSGHLVDAVAGKGRLRALAATAAGRIAIMPGGGVRADNVAAILKATGAREIHAACGTTGCAPVQTDARAVEALRRAIDSAMTERVSA